MHASLGTDLIDVFAGGRLGQGVKSYFNERAAEVRATVTGAAAQFFDQARTLYSVIDASAATQILRNLKTKVDTTWQGNEITNLQTLQELQTAAPVMQRWIMAQPDLRSKFLHQEVQGYGESYVNYQGDAVGRRQYDFRRVTEGIVFEDDEGYHVTEYFEAVPDEDTPLTLHQKVDILKTWKQVEHYLQEADEDPTSPEGLKL